MGAGNSCEVLMSELKPEQHAAFPKTEWSVVHAAGQAESPLKHVALGTVLARYLPVLKSHLVNQFRVSEDQANDWLQGFVLEKMLEKNLIAEADSSRGRFRSFLLRALNNYVIGQLRKSQASKRAPESEAIQLEEVGDRELADCGAKGADSFDLDWARNVLGETLGRMERQCATGERAAIWIVFEARILKPLLEDVEPVSYEDLINNRGLESPAQASNYLITAKRMFARFLREVVSEYTKDDQEIEAEIEDLKAILFRS
jgi:hypothetical protein